MRTFFDGQKCQFLLEQATTSLYEITDFFCQNIGAGQAILKSEGDFATAADLHIEEILRKELFRKTGIAVLGEEFGGFEKKYETFWVVDPVDGTTNYSASIPLAAILVALIHENQPIASIIYLPFSQDLFSATKYSPLLHNGKVCPNLGPKKIEHTIVSIGGFTATDDSFMDTTQRIQLCHLLAGKKVKIRMFGSIGIETALVARGGLSGAFVFGDNVWDNAPGALLVRSAGGIVTDLAGNPWSLISSSMLVGRPGVHQELLAIIETLTDLGGPCEENR